MVNSYTFIHLFSQPPPSWLSHTHTHTHTHTQTHRRALPPIRILSPAGEKVNPGNITAHEAGNSRLFAPSQTNMAAATLRPLPLSPRSACFKSTPSHGGRWLAAERRRQQQCRSSFRGLWSSAHVMLIKDVREGANARRDRLKERETAQQQYVFFHKLQIYKINKINFLHAEKLDHHNVNMIHTKPFISIVCTKVRMMKHK